MDFAGPGATLLSPSPSGLGTVVRFDGITQSLRTDDPAVNPTAIPAQRTIEMSDSPLTFAVWVMPLESQSYYLSKAVLWCARGANAVELCLRQTADRWKVEVRNGTSSYTNPLGPAVSAQLYRWTHIVVVLDSLQRLVMYQDGVLGPTPPVSCGAFLTAPAVSGFGYAVPAVDRVGVRALVGEAAYWSRELALSEITTLYNSAPLALTRSVITFVLPPLLPSSSRTGIRVQPSRYFGTRLTINLTCSDGCILTPNVLSFSSINGLAVILTTASTVRTVTVTLKLMTGDGTNYILPSSICIPVILANPTYAAQLRSTALISPRFDIDPLNANLGAGGDTVVIVSGGTTFIDLYNPLDTHVPALRDTIGPSLSIEVWLKLASWDYSQVVVDLSDASMTNRYLLTTDYPTTVRFFMTVPGYGELSPLGLTGSPSLPGFGRWAHVAVIIDAVAHRVTLSIDGVERDAATIAVVPPPVVRAHAKLFKCKVANFGVCSNTFVGEVARFTLFDYALTPAQVAILALDRPAAAVGASYLFSTIVSQWTIETPPPSTLTAAGSDPTTLVAAFTQPSHRIDLLQSADNLPSGAVWPDMTAAIGWSMDLWMAR
jgi:hypothetical protein